MVQGGQHASPQIWGDDDNDDDHDGSSDGVVQIGWGGEVRETRAAAVMAAIWASAMVGVESLSYSYSSLMLGG